MSGPNRQRTLILGIGNTILGDDGLGVVAARKIQGTGDLPDHVQVIDGGTCGLDLIHYLEGVERLVLIDAVNTGEPPGTLVCLDGDQTLGYLGQRISPHEAGIPDLLQAACLCGLYPAEVKLFGLTPACIECSLDLSPIVAERLDELIDRVMNYVFEPPILLKVLDNLEVIE